MSASNALVGKIPTKETIGFCACQWMTTQMDYPAHMHQDFIGLHPGFENESVLFQMKKCAKGLEEVEVVQGSLWWLCWIG